MTFMILGVREETPPLSASIAAGDPFLHVEAQPA